MKNRFVLISLLIIISIHLLFLLNITYFPYPELFIYSYLKNIGLLPYKQILDQHFPGLMLTPINILSLGFTTPQKTRFIQLFLVIVNHLLIYKVTLYITKKEKFSLISNILYLIWQPFYEGYVLWIDSFMPMFLLSSFLILKSEKNKKSTKNMFFAGVILGLALFFKQIILPLLGVLFLYLVFVKTRPKEIFVFLLGVSLFPLVLIIYIFKIGVFKDFVYWTYTFNMGTFAEMGRKLPTFNDLIKVSPVFGLAFVYLVYKLIKEKLNNKYILLFIFYTLALLFAYARFDYVHLQPALVFAVITLTLFVNEFRKLTLLILPFYIIAYIFFMKPFVKYNWGNSMPFFGTYEDQLSKKVLKHTTPGSTIFAYGTTLHLYYLTKTRPPGDIFVFQFPWFLNEAHGKILEGLEKDNPQVVVRQNNVTISGIPILDYSRDINAFIDQNYEIIDHVDETEILIKK